jgi:WD40 repeat protein
MGDGTVRMKDLASGKTVWEAPADDHAFVTCIVFSPDGSTALVGYDVEPVGTLPPSGKVRLYEAATGRELGTPLEHPRPVHAAAFHPDGVRFVTECGTWGDVAEGVEARFWDLQGRQTREPLPHASFTPAVAFSPDGTRLLTGHWDRT